MYACSTSAPQGSVYLQCKHDLLNCQNYLILREPSRLPVCLHPSAGRSYKPTNQCFRSLCSAPRQNHGPFLSQRRHGCGGCCGRRSRHRALREPDAVDDQGVCVCGRGELLGQSFFSLLLILMVLIITVVPGNNTNCYCPRLNAFERCSQFVWLFLLSSCSWSW